MNLISTNGATWCDENENDEDQGGRVNRVTMDEVDFFSNDKSSSPEQLDDVSMKNNNNNNNNEIYDPHCNLRADHVNVSQFFFHVKHLFLFPFLFAIISYKVDIKGKYLVPNNRIYCLFY